MSQAIADAIVNNLREQIAFLQDMCAIYPGDPTGEITLDCMVMEGICDAIEDHDWDLAREHNREKLPKVEITYDP